MGAGLLQIAVGPGDHVGVPALEELGIKLVRGIGLDLILGVALDLYVNAKASNAGISVEGIETYAFQGKIFDDLSDEYQENYPISSSVMPSGVRASTTS